MQNSQYISDPLSEGAAGGGLKADNAAYKPLVYMATSECAKLALGVRESVVLNSCADSVVRRLAFCALAMLMCPTCDYKLAAA